MNEARKMNTTFVIILKFVLDDPKSPVDSDRLHQIHATPQLQNKSWLQWLGTLSCELFYFFLLCCLVFINYVAISRYIRHKRQLAAIKKREAQKAAEEAAKFCVKNAYTLNEYELNTFRIVPQFLYFTRQKHELQQIAVTYNCKVNKILVQSNTCLINK